MRYGDLTVYTGPMFAEKTNSLIKEILFRTYFESPHHTRYSSWDLMTDMRKIWLQVMMACRLTPRLSKALRIFVATVRVGPFF